VKGLANLKPRVLSVALNRAMPGLDQNASAWGSGRGGRPWRRLRLQILERDRYLCQCEDCKAQNLLTPADEVDHIIPVSQGGETQAYNLRAINAEHHKLKTAKESQAGRR
jgi:5-methylcytosine-specific restriction protein A